MYPDVSGALVRAAALPPLLAETVLQDAGPLENLGKGKSPCVV